MCNKQKHRWYDVIVAWANGEKIQFNFKNCGWKDFVHGHVDVPGFNNEHTEWRIKPKTVTKKVSDEVKEAFQDKRKDKSKVKGKVMQEEDTKVLL